MFVPVKPHLGLGGCTKITADYSEWSLGFISRFGDKHFWGCILGIALSSVCQSDISLHFLQKQRVYFPCTGTDVWYHLWGKCQL